MLSRLVTQEKAVKVLGLDDHQELEAAVTDGLLKPAESGAKSDRFRLVDIVLLQLSLALTDLGVEPMKAARYSEAILGQRLEEHGKNALEWIENEAQELFCQIADGELARIFLRGKDDLREVEVGAVKPILFPTTRCEINVFRVIRPVIFRARQMLGSR
jgi:hypothetical protein